MHLKLIGTALKSKTGRKVLIIGLGVALLILITTMLIPVIAIAGIMEPINTAVESIQTSTADFFNKLDHFLKGEGWSTDEEAFIRTFQKKSNYYRDKGVTINGALIMSTLMTKQLYIGENPAEQDLGENYENFDETRADVMSIPYGNMIGDMRKLVEHQVNKVFSIPSDADPSVYETIANPPLALLQNAAILMQTTVDSLTNNVTPSNENYLAYLRFGTYATEERIEQEKEANSIVISGGSNSGNIRLTHFRNSEDENSVRVGYDGMSPTGYRSERFSLNEKGWWMYYDPNTNKKYLAVAAPTPLLLNQKPEWTYNDNITYYEYGDIIPLNIAGEQVESMVIDSCGACMEATDPLKIDVYVEESYFTETTITPAGQAAGAIMPDSLPTTMGDVTYIDSSSDDFWSYREPTEEEKSQVDKYKNGYIYNAYRDAFKDSNGNDLGDNELVQKVERIIRTIYDMQESYSEYNSSLGVEGPIEQRTTNPERNNPFYYDQTTGYGLNGTLEGECAWYATGRAAEFLASINSTETWTGNTDGGYFCSLPDAQKFNTGNEPKAGSIVSWKGGSEEHGHVAFVEKVNSDGSFEISEAAVGWGRFGSQSEARNFIRSSANQNEARKINCEGGQKCFNYRTITNINYATGYSLDCFIYLREPKNGGS